MKKLIKKWLGIKDNVITFEDFVNLWWKFKRRGTGIGINGKEYPPTFENWMKEEFDKMCDKRQLIMPHNE